MSSRVGAPCAISLWHVGLWRVEIPHGVFTNLCTCWWSKCTLLCIFQQPLTIEACFNFSNALPVTYESLCSIRIYLHLKKVVLLVLVINATSRSLMVNMGVHEDMQVVNWYEWALPSQGDLMIRCETRCVSTGSCGERGVKRGASCRVVEYFQHPRKRFWWISALNLNFTLNS